LKANPTPPPGLARALAEFVVASRHGDFTPRARALATDAIVDCMGCMIAGTREPIAGIVRRVIAEVDVDNGGTPLLGSSITSSPADAALYHGVLAHALDYDDTNHPAYAHPSAVVVPAALAAARHAPVTGRDLVNAYIVGVEVFGKLGRALNTAHYRKGWHATATFGTLAAAAVAGQLMDLTTRELETAIGIAASAAGGLRVNFGTMVKPLHAGYAARNGVLAAALAHAGLTASDASLDHAYGYVNVFAGEGGAEPQWLERWGDPLEITTDYGVALKPYPSCGATHPAIEAAVGLHDEILGRAIVDVWVGACRMAFEPLIYSDPDTPLQAKFSMQYCVAAALVDGRVDLATFTQQRMADASLRSLVRSVRLEVEEAFADNPEFAATVSVRLADGTRLARTVMLAIGKPARWPDRAQMFRKFADCAAASLPKAALKATFDRLIAIDTSAPIGDLVASLSSDATGTAMHPRSLEPCLKIS
jgi:2-methylcitrate dehydratase PrpD